MNAFSILQGATRYATHQLAEVEEDLYLEMQLHLIKQHIN